MNEYSARYDHYVECANCGNSERAMEMIDGEEFGLRDKDFCKKSCLEQYEANHQPNEVDE